MWLGPVTWSNEVGKISTHFFYFYYGLILSTGSTMKANTMTIRYQRISINNVNNEQSLQKVADFLKETLYVYLIWRPHLLLCNADWHRSGIHNIQIHLAAHCKHQVHSRTGNEIWFLQLDLPNSTMCRNAEKN